MSADPDDAAVRRAGADLALDVTQSLLRQRVPAQLSTQSSGGPAPAGGLRLDLTLVKLQRGSQWKRTVVGFGLGRSELQVVATLGPSDGGTPLLVFQADADSGREPGAATALLGAATGGSVLLTGAGAAISGARLSGTGTDRDLAGAAEVIVRRLDQYFRMVGWVDWTSAPHSSLGLTREPLPRPVPAVPALNANP